MGGWGGCEGEEALWPVAVTSGVVEIFQQCAPLLLGDVHLILQVLGTSRHQFNTARLSGNLGHWKHDAQNDLL